MGVAIGEIVASCPFLPTAFWSLLSRASDPKRSGYLVFMRLKSPHLPPALASTQVQSGLSVPLSACVTLGKLLSLSGPCTHHL